MSPTAIAARTRTTTPQDMADAAADGHRLNGFGDACTGCAAPWGVVLDNPAPCPGR